MTGYTLTRFGDIAFGRRVWDESRPWLPHRCIFTGNWIPPFKKAVRSRMPLPGGYAVHWSTSKEVTIQRLRGNLE